jgi:hypothetical protein
VSFLSVFGTDQPLMAPSLVACVFFACFLDTPKSSSCRPDLDGSDDFGMSFTSVSFSTSTGCCHDDAAQIVASVALVCTVYTHPLHSYHYHTVARLDFGPSFIENAFSLSFFCLCCFSPTTNPALFSLSFW